MTQHTFIAYRDQGNTLYEASHQHTIVIEDDDGVYDGVFYEDDYYSEIRDDNEYLSIDGVSVDSGSSPYIYHQSFYDAAGVSHQELFYYFHAEGHWYILPEQGSTFGPGSVMQSRVEHGNPEKWNYTDVTCFTKGTLIETRLGQIAVENLRPGMEISTADGKTQKLRHNLCRRRPQRKFLYGRASHEKPIE